MKKYLTVFVGMLTVSALCCFSATAASSLPVPFPTGPQLEEASMVNVGNTLYGVTTTTDMPGKYIIFQYNPSLKAFLKLKTLEDYTVGGLGHCSINTTMSGDDLYLRLPIFDNTTGKAYLLFGIYSRLDNTFKPLTTYPVPS